MANPLTSSEFRRLFDKNIREVMQNEYDDLPKMRDKLFGVIDSDSDREEFYSVGALPDIPAFNGSLEYLTMAPGFHTRIEPKEFAGGVEMERKLFDDKKFAVMDDLAAELVRSMDRTEEKHAARAFTQAFSSAFDFMVSEENQALCSSSHTTKSGASTSTGFDNAGSSALNKTSVATTRLLMRQFKNDIGEIIGMGDDFALIVPDALADKAYEIVGTQYGLDTAEGNKNMQYQRFEVIPYRRLDDTDSNNWFMVNKTMMKKHLKWINRIRPETAANIDFNTFGAQLSIYGRFGYGFTDWRWIYGHNVS